MRFPDITKWVFIAPGFSEMFGEIGHLVQDASPGGDGSPSATEHVVNPYVPDHAPATPFEYERVCICETQDPPYVTFANRYIVLCSKHVTIVKLPLQLLKLPLAHCRV